MTRIDSVVVVELRWRMDPDFPDYALCLVDDILHDSSIGLSFLICSQVIEGYLQI